MEKFFSFSNIVYKLQQTQNYEEEEIIFIFLI